MDYSIFPKAIFLTDSTIPAHYGNPLQEQDILRNARGVVDLSTLEIVTVRGTDRKKWLHSLTTCPFADLEVGESRDMLMLDPYGHIEHVAAAIDDGIQTWLICDVGRSQPLMDFLNSMRFMLQVEVERQEFSIFGFLQPATDLPECVHDSAIVVWEDHFPQVLTGGAHYGIPPEEHRGRSSHRSLAIFSSVQFATVATQLLEVGYQPVGTIAWEATRVADWRPRPNTEVVERVLPHELDWLRTGVHTQKGCYRGQETVAKILNLGRPPRRLTYLYLEGEAELPKTGSAIYNGQRSVGVITSVALDYEEGLVALALLQRATPLTAVLRVGEFQATQIEIVSMQGKSSISPQRRPGSELRALKELNNARSNPES